MGEHAICGGFIGRWRSEVGTGRVGYPPGVEGEAHGHEAAHNWGSAKMADLSARRDPRRTDVLIQRRIGPPSRQGLRSATWGGTRA